MSRDLCVLAVLIGILRLRAAAAFLTGRFFGHRFLGAHSGFLRGTRAVFRLLKRVAVAAAVRRGNDTVLLFAAALAGALNLRTARGAVRGFLPTYFPHTGQTVPAFAF